MSAAEHSQMGTKSLYSKIMLKGLLSLILLCSTFLGCLPKIGAEKGIRYKKVYLFQALTLQCLGKGKRIWYKNDNILKRIQSNKRVAIKRNGMSLKIKRIKPNDEGLHICYKVKDKSLHKRKKISFNVTLKEYQERLHFLDQKSMEKNKFKVVSEEESMSLSCLAHEPRKYQI